MSDVAHTLRLSLKDSNIVTKEKMLVFSSFNNTSKLVLPRIVITAICFCLRLIHEKVCSKIRNLPVNFFFFFFFLLLLQLTKWLAVSCKVFLAGSNVLKVERELTYVDTGNSLPNNKILERIKLNTFANNKLKVGIMVICIFHGVENLLVKRENAV